MIPLSFLLAVQQSRYIAPPDVREPIFALAFAREAHTGISGDTDPYFDRHGEPRIDAKDPKVRTYEYIIGDAVSIDVETGRIRYYSGGGDGHHAIRNEDGSIVPSKISDRLAAAAARRIYAAAGHIGDIDIIGIQDLAGSSQEEVEVTFHPVEGGVPYFGDGGRVGIDRQTGFVLTYYGPRRRSLPPSSLVPALSLAAARARALADVAERSGEAVAESAKTPYRLVVYVPSDRPLADESPAVARARREGRGILAYVGVAEGSERVWTYLDAQTGARLASQSLTNPASRGQGGISNEYPPRAAVLPPTAPHPWRTLIGGELSDPATAVLVPVAVSPPVGGTKLVLTDGHTAFPVRYDAPSNLLAVSGKTYRPGPALAALLRRRAKP